MPPKSDMLVKLPTGHWRVDASGRWYPNIEGGDGPDDDTDDADENEDQGSERTFTQKDLDRIAAKEKREGRKAAMREFMDKFDFDSIEDATKFFEDAKAAGSKDGEDAAKRLKAVEERERKTAERERKAIEKSNAADVIAALVDVQMPKAKAKKALRLVDVDLSADDLTEDEIEEAVATLKEEMPELFGVTEETKEETEWRPVGSPDSTARGGQRRRPQPQTSAEKAKQLLASRHPTKFNQSA